MIILLAYGCPLQAIIKAFDLDERNVRDWHERAGKHCQNVHKQIVEKRQQDLQQVQADEIKVKTLMGSCWMALAMAVPTRLWLGGVVSRKRDLDLIQSLVDKIRAIALCRPLLLAADGLASYVMLFGWLFEVKCRIGEVKSVAARWFPVQTLPLCRLSNSVLKEGTLTVDRHIVQGSKEMVERLIRATQNDKGVINTAFIERLNATFRLRLNNLVPRTRTLTRRSETLLAGMYITGCFYNFCDYHHSLRLKLSLASFGYYWVQRTPAIAAKLAEHRWIYSELFAFKVHPPRWSTAIQRGRPSQAMLDLAKRWAI